ncbi:hypothetical protein GCM10025787_03280 [Saccharopolyspora rosea]|uniref:DUF2637 domain-containing protein n=1 Tax=Saccharopolyspora rosea TaxID=524884 RepID=A0ABW3FNG7_9PSEU
MNMPIDWVQAREARRSAAAERRREDRRVEREERRKDRELAAKLAEQRARERRERRSQARARWWAVAREYGLWLPLIVAPTAMAWSAQTDQGQRLYGPVGVLLPVLTETAAWVISFEIGRRLKQGVAVGRARVAMWAVAAATAMLAFLKGVSTSVPAGLVMAVVAIAGLAVHQIKVGMDAAAERGEVRAPGLGVRWLWSPVRSVRAAYRSAVTGRPVTEVYDSRSREERRLDRQAARRVRAMRRAAVKQASGRLHPDGRVSLLHGSGVVSLASSRRFRGPELAPVESGHDEWVHVVEDWVNTQHHSEPDEGSGTGSRPDDQPELGTLRVVTPTTTTPAEPEEEPMAEPSAAERVEDARNLARARECIRAGELPPRPTIREIQDALRIQRQRAARIRRQLHDDRGQNAA